MNKGNGRINSFKNIGQDKGFNIKRINIKSTKESEVENLVEKEREEHIITGCFKHDDRNIWKQRIFRMRLILSIIME